MSKRSRTESTAAKPRKPKKAEVKPGANMYKQPQGHFGPENKRVFTCVNNLQMIDAVNGVADASTGAPVLENASITDTSATTANRTYLSAGILPDGSSSGRVGKKIWLDAIQLRGIVKPRSSKLTGVKNTSLNLIWVRHPNGSAAMPSPALVFEPAAGTGLPSCLSCSNLDNASDFRILRRWDFKTGNGMGASTVPVDGVVDGSHLVDEYISLKKQEIVWKTADTTGAWANLEEGGLFLMFLGDQTLASANYNLFQFSCRLYFYSG